MTRSLLISVCLGLALTACNAGSDPDTLPTKQSILAGQTQGTDQCVRFGYAPGCDVCAELGFYGDGICDQAFVDIGLCDLPDDWDCASAEVLCGDGLDNDGDGLVDCADADCWADCGGGVCGNALLEAGEECDDGNADDGDGCAADCTREGVTGETNCSDRQDEDGDGFMDCDDPDCAADPACQPYCGDGVLQPGEECDDANNDAGDGCSPACLIEGVETQCDNGLDDDGDGLVDCSDPDCAADPACAPVCGNGLLEGDELCDDGNVIDGDGCSSTCWIEESDCSDGIDDDRDGLVDCADPDCASDPTCAP